MRRVTDARPGEPQIWADPPTGWEPGAWLEAERDAWGGRLPPPGYGYADWKAEGGAEVKRNEGFSLPGVPGLPPCTPECTRVGIVSSGQVAGPEHRATTVCADAAHQQGAAEWASAGTGEASSFEPFRPADAAAWADVPEAGS